MSIIAQKTPEKQLTPEELQSVKQLRKEYSDLVLSLGELELQKLNLEKDKEKLHQQYNQLFEKEANLVNTLTSKYGKGSINIETGEVS